MARRSIPRNETLHTKRHGGSAMRHRLIGSLVGLAAIFVFSSCLLAQNARPAAAPKYQVPAGAQGLFGVWNWGPTPDNNRMLLTLKPLPMQDWAQEKYNTNKNPENS